MASLLACCSSDDNDKAARIKSKHIDVMIARQKKSFRKTVKLLLLGAGESGKSTFLKQMRIIHGLHFDDDQMLEFKHTIYMNIVKGMKVLVDARDKLNIPWGDDQSAPHGKIVFETETSSSPSEPEFLEVVPSVQVLWKDKGIKTSFDRRREFQLTDSLQYYMSDLSRIAVKGYQPTIQDVLHARRPTKGIHEQKIEIKGIPFVFVDVGGQRSQRQKWFQCFDNVTSILFLASSSEFDQVLMEDRETNRLSESLNIFDTIVNNRTFARMSIILFLNKADLLQDKVRQVNFNEYFPEFPGDPRSLEEVQNFMLHLFDSRRREREKLLFHHFTTAVDTENIKFVFQAVRDTILQDNLQSLMLK